LTNSTAYSGGGESLLLGQSFDEPVYGITGPGLLATVNFTFVLPGATFVRFLEAYVTDDNMYSTDLLANSVSGRVTTNMPHPQFWWWTDDTDGARKWDADNAEWYFVPGDVSAKTHGAGPIPSETVNDADRGLSTGTTVYFTGNFSYDTATRMVWDETNKTYYATGAINISTYVWDYGDGVVDVYTGGNLTDLTDHVYTAYNQAGYLVNLTVYTGASKTGNYWSSTWRYQGPTPDDTVPMWRDVGVVDIWPSLIPFEGWNPYMNGTWGSDWFAPWWFDIESAWLPNVNDAYWNYTVPPAAAQYWGLYTGTVVPSADKRLYPAYTGYAYGSYVKQAGYFAAANDTDVGKALTSFSAAPAGYKYRYYDRDFSASYNNLDSIVMINSTSRTVFNSTLGDVWYNQAVADGSSTLAISSWVRYYDADSSGTYTAGEAVYYDYYPRGTVLGQWTSVKQAWDLVGDLWDSIGEPYPGSGLQGEGPGLNILITANNYGSVSETCTVNLYAIGIAVEAGASPVQKLSVEQIGQWTGVVMMPHSGSGWNLACNWLPAENSVYMLLATIETDQLSSGADQILSNNFLSKSVSNIAIFNMTSLELVPPWMVWNKYLCDINNDGTVGPADFSWITSNFGNRIVGNDYYAIIPTS
jgi:hypothetical protein